MTTKPRAFIPFLLLLSILLLSATLALSTTEGEDPERRLEKEYREHRGGKKEEEEREEGKGEEKRRGSDPFFFDEESFVHRVRTDRGRIRVLRNFIEKSRLLLGVANYRVSILEVDPKTFVIPSHFDAENIMFVTCETRTFLFL